MTPTPRGPGETETGQPSKRGGACLAAVPLSTFVPSHGPLLRLHGGDLAHDESVRLRCACRIRAYTRAELAAAVGRDARLHLIGLHKALWCRSCGEPPFHGWVVGAAAPWGGGGYAYLFAAPRSCGPRAGELVISTT